MTTPDIVFVDIETTGLDPDRHRLWELAAVHLDGRAVYGRWQVDLDGADGRAHTAMYDALQARRLWVQLAAKPGVIADWPAHDVVIQRAGEHVKAWDHGLPLAPEPVPDPPARSTTPLTDRLSQAGSDA